MNVGRALRILLADDSRETADVTAELIRLSMDCEVRLAHDGVEALAAAKASRPDVMLLDLYMPGLDGIEVARLARAHFGADSPYLIALTGQPGSARNLAAIDHQFDRAFAKPLDIDQLIATLARLASGKAGVARSPVPFDLAELFTRAARQVIPVTRHLCFSFDYRGPGVIVRGEPIDVQCGVHRLLLGAVDMFRGGFVLFSAEASLEDSGHCSIVVEAAGNGPLRTPVEVAEVLRRLALVDTVDPAVASGSHRSATGVCPNTGSPIEFDSDVNEGTLLRMTLTYENAVEDEGSRSAEAPGARAWLVDEDELPSSWLHRRLQRLGWLVTRFVTCTDALAQMRSGAVAENGPSLLVLVDSTDLSFAEAEALRRALPAETHCLLAVMAGSPRLGKLDFPAGYELRVYPFSPMELAAFCALASPNQPGRSGLTMPAPLGMEDRPPVLLVDDNEINRIVGRGLVEALGYEVDTANDGLDAIDRCRQAPPRIVLMDLDMPVLRGVDATLRLRELQRSGALPPFPIVAATADTTPEARAACERAGMDAYMTKPLRFEELREHLRRFAALR